MSVEGRTFLDARALDASWAPRSSEQPTSRPQGTFAANRRARISELHTGERLIIPAGSSRVRSNDTDYRFRAHSAFSYLTAWGSDAVPGSVLVLEPNRNGHLACLYMLPDAGRDSDDFYSHAAIGEFWTAALPSLTHVAIDLGLETRHLGELTEALDSVEHTTRIVRDADRELTIRVDRLRLETARTDTDTEFEEADGAFQRDLSELRLVKDAYEVGEMRRAVDATKLGFDDVIAYLPQIVKHPRGERLVEGTFYRRARAEGNAVGYDTIAASGPHACTLHWTRNDGPVLPGDLILLDAGVELDSLYTADITRTLPISGTFTPIQRQVYEAVLEAADAAAAVVRPGILFREVQAAAMDVIARRTAEWGMLPVSAEESLDSERQFHRRYLLHGTSHHLGIDVHDCAQARRELYLDGELLEGMVFTIEPGLYFQPDDLTVPEEYRGIGVRIEDNVLVTAEGCENLSADFPRTPLEVERWVRGCR